MKLNEGVEKHIEQELMDEAIKLEREQTIKETVKMVIEIFDRHMKYWGYEGKRQVDGILEEIKKKFGEEE